jgi:hypothetical protein
MKLKKVCVVVLAVMMVGGWVTPAKAQDTTKWGYWTPQAKQKPTSLNGWSYTFFAIGALASCYFVFKGIRKI